MILYHGTNIDAADSIITEGVLLNKSKKYVDFGRGFYTTDSLDFARKCALWKSNHNIDDAAIIEVNFDEKVKDISVMHFDGPTRDWAQYVINNRNGIKYITQIGSIQHNLFPVKYDISVGPIADTDVVELARIIKRKNLPLSDEEYESLKAKNFGTQYSFHTKNALSHISVRMMSTEEWI